MTEKRLQGSFDWYNNLDGYGVIKGIDGGDYFAHKSNHPAIAKPEKGMAVTFRARARSHSKSGMEAYDVQLNNTPSPVKIASTPRPFESPVQKKPSDDIQIAAKEALRLKRLRRDGLAEQPVENLPPGTRVFHPSHGYGVVVLSARDILSVHLDTQTGLVVEVKRSEVMKVAEKQPVAETVFEQAPSAENKVVTRTKFLQTSSTISNYISRMASDVYRTLTEEGVEGNNIYKFEEADNPSSLPQPITIDPRIATAFHITSKITEFYSHQIKSRQALLQGKNVIISTPTASGKTESYNPTVLETLVNNPQATALYLFPLVALGLDQTERLEKLNKAIPGPNQLKIGIYNGSVPDDKKKETLKAENRILVTTPDSLHYIFLPKPYPNWVRFYRNLRYVVIDEAHIYKGVLGANMANIMRRLLIRCRREGNSKFPQIIISSATIRYPGKLAQQLTGLPAEEFEVITQSGAPKPGRHFLVTRSDIHDLDTICSDLLNVKTTNSKYDGGHFVSTIVFLRSINEVKTSARTLREHLSRIGRHDETHLVEEFYSDKGDKMDVLNRLRQGTVRCLFTTTALMAGIDIGSLDIAIVKNFPGLIMDARQMFGRAGRASEGAVIFIANRTDPFDQFYFDNPEQLFHGPVEDVVANPDNPILLAAHLKCASQTTARYNKEGPLPGQWSGLFGQMGKDLLDSLISQNSIQIQAGSYYLNSEDPHDLEPLDNIRSASGEMYLLKNVVNNQLLEEKREATAFRDAHQEAIIWVNGNNFKVISFDTTTREIMCKPLNESELRTRGLEEVDISILSADASDNRNISLGKGVTIQSGEINITTSVQNYVLYKSHLVMQCRARSCRYETPDLNVRRCIKCGSPVRPKQIEEVVDKYPIPAPPVLNRNLKTRAFWINFHTSLKDQFSNEFWPRWNINDEENPGAIVPNFEFALHSVEHSILKAFPEYIPCDRDEIGGIYKIDSDGLPARLFIYDNFQGGLGLSDELMDEAYTLLEGALRVIERCTCIDDQGCPVCLSYFGCHNFNQSLSKLSGRYLLNVLLGKDTSNVIADLDDYVKINIPSSQRVDKHSDVSG